MAKTKTRAASATKPKTPKNPAAKAAEARSGAQAKAGTQPATAPTKGLPTSNGRKRGTLLIIGGHESKNGDSIILKDVVERAGSGALVVTTVASEVAKDVWEEYRDVFKKLGVQDVRHLHIEDRETAITNPPLDVLDGASVVFFTGGQQIKITTQLGGTLLCEKIQELYDDGGTVAGTSAGASVLCDTMIIGGGSESSHKVEGQLMLAPGLGLIGDVIVDQHFAERGRIGRLLGAVAQNPRMLGIGIDENTAVVVERERKLRVLGDGAVYIADAFGVTHTNLADEDLDRTMSIFDVRLHLLSQGDVFDLETRRPEAGLAEEAETPKRRR
jgi:cyanophycinase